MAVSAADQLWVRTLEWLEQRNGPVDLAAAWDGRPTDLSPVFRSRLLALSGAGLVIERPQQRGVATALRLGEPVMLWAMDAVNRWSLTTTILDVVQHQLNEQMVVAALSLEWPASVAHAERRDAFRIDTSGLRLPPVTLNPTGRAQPDARGWRPHPDPFQATLVNISTGGLGVDVPPDHAGMARAYGRFACTVRLPGGPKPIVAPMRGVWHDPRYNGACYVGLRFDTDASPDRDRFEAAVLRFIASIQQDAAAPVRSTDPRS